MKKKIQKNPLNPNIFWWHHHWPKPPHHQSSSFGNPLPPRWWRHTWTTPCSSRSKVQLKQWANVNRKCNLYHTKHTLSSPLTKLKYCIDALFKSWKHNRIVWYFRIMFVRGEGPNTKVIKCTRHCILNLDRPNAWLV